MGGARSNGDSGNSPHCHGGGAHEGHRTRHPSTREAEGRGDHKPEGDYCHMEQEHWQALLQCHCLDGWPHKCNLQVVYF